MIAAAAGAFAQAGVDDSPRAVDVVHYTARIVPDFASSTISGQATLRVVVRADRVDAIDLDSEVTVDAVREGRQALAFSSEGRRLTIRLPRPAPRGERRELAIDYHASARAGLQFPRDRSQVYTVFSTRHWLPSLDAPDARATLDLTLVLPGDVAAVGSGDFRERRQRRDGMVEHEWRLRRPAPAYTFGYAAGRFAEARDDDSRPRLRYLGSGFAPADLRRVFEATRDMLTFFAERSGVPYPHDAYTQALVASTAGQEMSGFSIVSEDYGRAVLEDPKALSLLAHELAHQWWGNEVTCRDFTHFWLNEGMATFMAAAYVEHRFGRQAYEEAIAASRQRYERVAQAGHDRALVFPEWNRPTADDRTIVYHKGAYALHRLRETLGDDRFWPALRAYTRGAIGSSVTSDDFQRAFEAASGRSLAQFFTEWVR